MIPALPDMTTSEPPSAIPPPPPRPAASRAARLLMFCGALGAVGVLGLLLIAGHASRTTAVAPGPGGSAAATATLPEPSGAGGLILSGSPPPPLQLRPRLLDGSVLGTLAVPGAAAHLQVVEGLGQASGDVGHDAASAYPGEPHAMVLVAGPSVTLPALAGGTTLDLAAVYGVYHYRVTAEGPAPAAPAPDAPELRLLLGPATHRTQVTASLVPGDAQTEAELLEEVAVAQAQQQAVDRGIVGGSAPTRLLAPCQGPISQGFGPTDYSFEFPFVYNGVYYPHFHTGIDLAIPLGTPIHVAASGTVVLATTNVANGVPVGFGTYILVSHGGGLYSLYGHLSQLNVRAGQQVQAGQQIGLSGSTGNSTGPHLHFEVRSGRVPVDPLPLLS